MRMLSRATIVHSGVSYELTRMSGLNNTDGIRDISYVAANMLKLKSVYTRVQF